MTRTIRTYILCLMAFLIVGVGISWTTVLQSFVRFYNNEGTLFKIQNCLFPNPVTTPCFYGAIAFLICLVWAIYLYRALDRENISGSYIKLMWLLFASTIFGWVNVGYELYQFSQSPKGIVGCTSKVITSPWQSPCIYGSIMFLLSLIAVYTVVQKFKNKRDY
ncbi:MAG: hypothetical protein ABI643_00385 [Candidatus Doudnabacteria bacterium]